VVDVAEAAEFGDVLYAVLAALQQFFGVLHAYLRDVFPERHLHFLFEQAAKVRLVQVCLLG
jgi:small basic protein